MGILRTMKDFTSHNLNEINNLNQRGGRMLSLVDLIERGTVPLELGAYFLSIFRMGANVLIGAEPGAAGKTTLMGALLGILNPKIKIETLNNKIVRQLMEKGQSSAENSRPTAFTIHEIGSGNWYGYMWGKSVANALKILDDKTFLYSNLHPDTIQSVYSTFESFGAQPEQMLVFDLIIFLEYDYNHNPSRYIREVWQKNSTLNDKSLHHRKIYGHQKGFLLEKDKIDQFNSKEYKKAMQFLEECAKNKVLKIEAVQNHLNNNNCSSH